MANFGEDFRAEVTSKPGEAVFRTVGGWRFGLSFGYPKTVSREQYEFVKSGRGSVHANKTARPLTQAMPYEEYKERNERVIANMADSGLTDHTWIFTASLWPRGRASTKRDWEYLGEMLAAVGVPDVKGCCLTPIGITHPNDVHYWQWEEKESEKN